MSFNRYLRDSIPNLIINVKSKVKDQKGYFNIRVNNHLKII